MSVSQASSTLLSDLSKWHQGREPKPEVQKEEQTFNRLLDTFSCNLGKLKAEDNGPRDRDHTAGNVELVDPDKNEVLQLQKRGDSTFRMVTLTPDEQAAEGPLRLTAYEMDLSNNTITCFEYDNTCVEGVTAPVRTEMGNVNKTVLNLNQQQITSQEQIPEHFAGMQMEGDDLVWMMRDRLGKA